MLKTHKKILPPMKVNPLAVDGSSNTFHITLNPEERAVIR